MSQALSHPLAAGLAPVDGWTVKSLLPGRLRAHHPVVRRSAMAGDRIRLLMFSVAGVQRVSFNRATSRVLIKYDERRISADEILRLLAALLRDEPGLATAEDYRFAGEDYRSERRLSLATANLGLALGAARSPVLRIPALLGTVGASAHILLSAGRSIVVERRLRVDVLDSIVIVMLLASNSYFAAAIMTWLLSLADTILESTSRSSRELIGELFGQPSRLCWKLLPDGPEIRFPVAELAPGDVIVVRAGEQIPVDGLVREGEAVVDQHVLTGEHAPVDRGMGEPVFGMTTVLAGRLTVEVRETAETSNAAKIAKIVEGSMQHRLHLQTVSERFADRMVVPTLGLGGAGYLLAGQPAMIAILNADYGTGIRVAGPLALVASLSVAARHGIVIKNGSVLETLRKVDAVVFDKTGTLTREVPEVGAVHAYDPGLTPERILAYAACAERKFSHPIAKAILKRVEELGLDLPEVDESTYHVGFGIQVEVDGEVMKVGSRRFMELAGVAIPGPAAADLEAIAAEGRSAVLVALGQRLAGAIEIRATAREEAFDLIANLKTERGIREIALLSGDHEAPTEALARKLAIDHYRSEMLSEDKARYVRELKARGFRVAMVGDGINDAMALTAADCSISISGATDVALDVADVVFVDGDFAKFSLLFEISEKLHANVQRSFVMAIVPNTVLIVGALAGWFGIRSSIVLNNLFNLLAALNGLLPYRSALGVVRDDAPQGGETDAAPAQDWS